MACGISVPTREVSASMLDKYSSYCQYKEMYQNGVILPDGILRQKDKSIAILEKDQARALRKTGLVS